MRKMILDALIRTFRLKWLLINFLQLFTLFGTIILISVLIGLPTSITIFSSCISTLTYILCTIVKVPVSQGNSFTYISVFIATLNGEKNNSGVIATEGSSVPTVTALFIVGVINVITLFKIRVFLVKCLEKFITTHYSWTNNYYNWFKPYRYSY